MGLVGCGYWGPKVLRAASALPDVQVTAAADLDGDRARAVARQFPGAIAAETVGEILDEVDALVLATNPATHATLAEHALAAGKHVLVEKPLALTVADCRRLGAQASARGAVLMTGHTFLYSPAVRHVRDLIDRDELGRIYTIDSQRLNLGRVRSDVDAVWNFAPHDVSIVNYWLDAAPVTVSATCHTYLQDGVADVGFITLEYEQGTVAHVHVSWLSPRKVRNMTVVGSKKMVVYDDTADDKIVVHDAGIDREHIERRFPEFETFAEFQLIQRLGDLHVPRLAGTEPLVAECRHFVDCIADGSTPVTGVDEATEVVAVLEAATASAKAGGTRVELVRA